MKSIINLQPVADRIYQAVVDAMQDAEELGGLNEEEYWEVIGLSITVAILMVICHWFQLTLFFTIFFSLYLGYLSGYLATYTELKKRKKIKNIHIQLDIKP